MLEEKQEVNEQKTKEFKKRVDMLVLALSLKENDPFFEGKEGYQLLLSTYIKMIENDQDDFFIEKERKAKIIQSLERTKVFYDFERKEQLQTVFGEMGNDDPTDFMLFLSAVSSRKYNTDRIHLCGFTVYKKNENFLVMKVDQERSFDNEIVTCFKIPSKHIEKLSQLFLWERGYVRRGTDDIFKSLKNLSIEVKVISYITIQHKKLGRCVVNRVEASLKTILFNCQKDIFYLPEALRVTPKWNLAHSEPTLEMRKRFVTAMKGEDEGWNQHFDYLFDYYLCRKGKLVSDSSLAIQTHLRVRYWEIRKIFSMDPYISEMLKNGGQIPTENVPLKKKEIKGIDPSGLLHMLPIKETSFINLKNTIEENEYKIKLFNERLPFINIQRAEEITQYIISCLEDKSQEIAIEIKRREELKMKAKEFERRVDMLALTLSLKNNDQLFEANEGYQLLFSTYIKMIENDEDSFFIEKERKEKVIQSLERTKGFYENEGQLQAVFEMMINDDPADFMLFPIDFFTDRDPMNIHVCGFTVYKKNEDFIVVNVDKDRSFNDKVVNFFKIPSRHIAKLSQLFFVERGYLRYKCREDDYVARGPYAIFIHLRALSSEAKAISAITMQEQSTSNCVVSEVEASIRTILFNCRTDIFSLPEDTKITPKWNLAHSEPTVEMRKRFLLAMKGEDEGWNQHFDYLFDYYLHRKGKLVRNSHLELHTLSWSKYWTIQEIFSMDAYISEMLRNGGQIPTEDVPLKEEKISGIDPTDMLNGSPIVEINSSGLEIAMEKNADKIKLFNERLSLIKIKRAEEITKYIITRLKDKNKEIDAELQRRKELEMETKEFEKRVNLLVLALSLKENDSFFEGKEGYQLLFSTYIKMIENDQNNFFIEEERKARIIQSLERIKAFYDFEKKEQLQTVFEKMDNDDPTDFMLFLSEISSRENDTDMIRLCGFTVYKKNENFLVMKVDKERSFDNKIVTCFVVSSKHIAKLSQLFLWERGYIGRGTDDIFTHLRALSSEIKAIPAITMQHKKLGRCVVSRVETSLKTILFNCQKDVYSLSKTSKVILKWNLKHSEPTIEMRKRFVTAMKGEDEGWDQHFDYLFDYYLCRKGKLVSDSSLAIQAQDRLRYWVIRKIFSMDPYISEMLKNGGQIPTENDSLKEEKINGIDPVGMFNNRPIKETYFANLKDAIEKNEYKIKLFNERLPLIKIKQAEEITQYIISRLEDKNKEIDAELQRREKIEKRNQDGKSSNQTLDQLVAKVVPHTKDISQLPVRSNAKASAEKTVFSELMMQSEKIQYKLQNSSQQEAGNIKNQTLQYEK
ncbi:hypothetical protein E1H99_00345 [Enterococcus hirae]|nr:hypothetical protein E1H99_00345 [Enterococcus hirae]